MKKVIKIKLSFFIALFNNCINQLTYSCNYYKYYNNK